MDNDLARLEKRVAALETALAAQAEPSARRIRRDSTLAFLTGMVVASTAVMLNTGIPLRAQGAGPSIVTAPFVVRDNAGKTLVSVNVNEATGFGTLYVYGRDVPGMKLTADAGGNGIIDLFNNGKPVVTVGSTSSGNGLIMATSPANRSTFMSGAGEFFATNAQGKRVVTLQVDGREQGDLHLRDRAGTDAIGFFVTPGGGGLGQIMRAKGDVSVEMGTKETGKGDVCVNGPKGSLCMTLLAVKAFIPY